MDSYWLFWLLYWERVSFGDGLLLTYIKKENHDGYGFTHRKWHQL